ncbi:hypothetical protein BT96DRAFT_1018372 [Gymnopus androsaceus JB14]|uniref:Uncharacterized protein n=1 Tax=Gymnopus androsaceus JB14 TaxID=1447944 RepID=A0A6A4HPW2_9AGAR|nr:hypothetical protein BT96DRAFT_1018372 [Gymnopus androsaceus JB14]
MPNGISLQALRKRASSDKPGSDEALKEICSMMMQSTAGIEKNLPILLEYLARNKPPESKPPTLTGCVLLPVDVLEATAFATCPREFKQGGSYTTPLPLEITSLLQKHWRSIYSWCSFFLKTYVDFENPLSFDDFEMKAFSIILMLFAVLIWKSIRARELAMTPEAPKMILKSHMYALAIDASLFPQKIDLCDCARNITATVLTGSERKFWENHCAIAWGETPPIVIGTVIRNLANLSHCSGTRMNYSRVHTYLQVISRTASLSSLFDLSFNRILMQHRSVYFITRILRRLSRHAASVWNALSELMPNEKKHSDELVQGATASANPSNQDCYKLFGSCRKQATNSPHSFGDPPSQRPIDRWLKGHPLDNVAFTSQIEFQGSTCGRIWLKFKEAVGRWIELRRSWDAQAGEFLLESSVIAAKKPTGLCIIETNAVKSHSSTKVGDGLPRLPDNREHEIVQFIVQAHLWSIRDDLSKFRESHRRQFGRLAEHPDVREGSAVGTPASIGVHDLIPVIDFTCIYVDAFEPEKWIWTYQEVASILPYKDWGAKMDVFLEWESKNPDRAAHSGPVSLARLPHPRNNIYLPIFLCAN